MRDNVNLFKDVISRSFPLVMRSDGNWQFAFFVAALLITALLAAGQAVTFAWLSSFPERNAELGALRVKFWSSVCMSLMASLGLLFCSFAMFDRLVRAEYETNRGAWEADGRPRGFLWRAPECTWLRSDFARVRLSLVWLFSTPTWAAESVTYRSWLSRLRICVLAWNTLILGAVAVIVSGLY